MTKKRKVYDINNETKSSKTTFNRRPHRIYDNESYITIKDHKEDFTNKISCRLTNSSKSFFFFFLFGFSFTNIHDSRNSRGRGRVSI